MPYLAEDQSENTKNLKVVHRQENGKLRLLSTKK
jgi:hypothetical protein